ncbi:hypothetical protein LQV05_005747 [Cryptococcus neoformans]|nr:hypothetical protein LQV05_005747 [Cryptococcus neoformans]
MATLLRNPNALPDFISNDSSISQAVPRPAEKRSRRAMERVRDENVQPGVVSVEDGGGLLKEKEARARKRVREGFENENIEVGTPSTHRRRRATAHAGSSQGSGRRTETPIR